MINGIAVCLSYISNDYLLMLVAVLFYIFSKRSEHAHLVILLLFAMVYKATLKKNSVSLFDVRVKLSILLVEEKLNWSVEVDEGENIGLLKELGWRII